MCKSQLRLCQLWCLRFSIKRIFYSILFYKPDPFKRKLDRYAQLQHITPRTSIWFEKEGVESPDFNTGVVGPDNSTNGSTWHRFEDIILIHVYFQLIIHQSFYL